MNGDAGERWSFNRDSPAFAIQMMDLYSVGEQAGTLLVQMLLLLQSPVSPHCCEFNGSQLPPGPT